MALISDSAFFDPSSSLFSSKSSIYDHFMPCPIPMRKLDDLDAKVRPAMLRDLPLNMLHPFSEDPMCRVDHLVIGVLAFRNAVRAITIDFVLSGTTAALAPRAFPTAMSFRHHPAGLRALDADYDCQAKLMDESARLAEDFRNRGSIGHDEHGDSEWAASLGRASLSALATPPTFSCTLNHFCRYRQHSAA
ncbi:hypothetical protein NM688_g8890 [Phlebia brevispora]|uniref:Uncharacterized protein n=1 Tax=Phlebia brevispora TaxID=194682 RepID=A0ACC1RNL0_9APHY|nr:hypothetical protein NM688_g8890 [Phlebia brevispora]